MVKILVTGSDSRFGKILKKLRQIKILFLKVKNNLIYYRRLQ